MPIQPPELDDARRKNAVAAEIKRRGLALPDSLTEKRDQIALEMTKRGLVPYKTFAEFVKAKKPSLLKFEHIPKLIDVADRILAGILKYVLIMAPPRYLKSEIFSRLLPAYYLLRFPSRTFALTSHAAHLAWELAESARENFVRAGGKLSPETQAKARWQTAAADASGQQGEMWANGMGGGIIGKGFNLGGVDDPIHPDHAFSWTYRKKFETWWENTWLRAREPQAQMFFVMQRLAMEDPIEYLMKQEVEHGGKFALHWHVVCLDEVHSKDPLGRWSGPQGLPPSCTLEPDAREVGQILSPSRFSREEVMERQNQSTPLVVAAQRQQRPMRAEGDFWKLDWFKEREYEVLPDNAYNGADDWDTALTADEQNSASARIRSYRGPAQKDAPLIFPVYIDDVDFRWVKFPELVAWIQSCPGPHHVEAKASGKSAVQQLKAYGVIAHEVPVKGDKLQRASGVQPHVSAGRVYINVRVVEKLLWAEQQGLLRITAEQLQAGGEGLDVNDAFVQALHRHLGIHQPARPVARVV